MAYLYKIIQHIIVYNNEQGRYKPHIFWDICELHF
jgi:hypothetical protein